MKKILAFLVLIANLSNAQTLIWDKELNFPKSQSSFMSTIDNSGNLLLAGTIDSNQNSTPFLVKLDYLGQEVFQWIAPDSVIDGRIRHINFDSNNNLYLLFNNYESNKLEFYKFDSLGNILYTKKLSPSFNKGDMVLNNLNILILSDGISSTLWKFNLEGDSIISYILPRANKISGFKQLKSDFIVLADTCDFNGCTQIFYLYDSAFNLKWQNILPNKYYNVIDWNLDSLGNIYACSKNNSLSTGYLFKLDTGGVISEISDVNSNTTQKLFRNVNGQVYWSYFRDLGIDKCIINKIVNDSVILIANIDSAYASSYNGLAMSEIGTNLIVSHTRRFKSLPILSIVISRYDQMNNLIWSYYNTIRKKTDNVSAIFSANNAIYSVNVNSNNGSKFYIFKLDATTGFPLFEKEFNLIKIYPNPVRNGLVNLEKEISNATLTIYNSYGKLIQSQENFNGNQILLNKDLAKGVYILKVQNQQGISSQKIIVQ